ncbi:MAG: hypothetical protein CMJ18_23830, partial [Phycisphaeraceae bacterium]|nr:hypothetical protein [Phycisphaeraceae bacterium]
RAEAPGDEDSAYDGERTDRAAAALGLGETEYRLNWMPLGGYVKMLGQDDMNPAAQVDDERSFNCKPIWARAVVVSAGVVMNLIFGVLFFIVCFLDGVEFPSAIAGDIDPSGPAALTYAMGHDKDPAYRGLRAGDHIVQIDGKPVTDFMQVAVSTALARRGSVLDVAVEREGHDGPLHYKLTPTPNPATRLLSLGIEAPRTPEIELVPTSGDFAFLHEQGVKPHMLVTAVDGKPVERYAQYHRAVAAARGRPTPVTFEDMETNETVTVQLSSRAALVRDANGPEHLIGLVPAVRISSVAEGSPAEAAGIRVGDHLAQVADERWPSIEMVTRLVRGADGAMMQLSVWRDGEEVTLDATAPGSDGMLGIGLEYDAAVIGRTIDGTTAAALDLIGGSRVTSIDGAPVETWSDMQRALQTIADGADGPVVVNLEIAEAIAGNPTRQKQVTIDADAQAELQTARWYPSLGSQVFAMNRQEISAATPMAAAALGIRKTHQFMLQTYVTLVRLFQGTVKLEHLRGPVGIVHEGTRIAKQGWSYLLFFLGVISVNLVVINFLPIPITDGGLMVFLIIEKLKGSPVSPKVQTAAFFVGLALIGSVFLITLYYDTGRLLP